MITEKVRNVCHIKCLKFPPALFLQTHESSERSFCLAFGEVQIVYSVLQISVIQ